MTGNQTQLSKFPHLCHYDFIQKFMIDLIDKPIHRQIGRQRRGDIKTAVICDNQFVLEIVPKIRDTGKALAFHYNKCTELCMIRITGMSLREIEFR